MAFVIDASALLALLFAELPQERIDRLTERLRDEATSVPSLFPFEIFNSLEMARRRRRIDAATVDLIGDRIVDLRLDVRPPPTMAQALVLRQLAERYGLSVYDASYLALAASTARDLVSLDAALIDAGRRAGLTVTPP